MVSTTVTDVECPSAIGAGRRLGAEFHRCAHPTDKRPFVLDAEHPFNNRHGLPAARRSHANGSACVARGGVGGHSERAGRAVGSVWGISLALEQLSRPRRRNPRQVSLHADQRGLTTGTPPPNTDSVRAWATHPPRVVRRAHRNAAARAARFQHEDLCPVDCWRGLRRHRRYGFSVGFNVALSSFSRSLARGASSDT